MQYRNDSVVDMKQSHFPQIDQRKEYQGGRGGGGGAGWTGCILVAILSTARVLGKETG